jgi:spore germination protein KB
MEAAKMSKFQFFCLVVLFELGGVIALGVGQSSARQDVWLSVLLGMIPGIVIYFVFSGLYKLYPTMPLTSYISKIIGPFLGKPIAFLYSVHFVYQSVRNFRGCANTIQVSVFDETPLVALLALMAVAMIYIVYLGIDAMLRTIVTFLLVLFALGLLGNIFIFFSGIIQIDYLLPVLENGWKPVINTVPLTYFLPFGELFVCTMFFHYLGVDTQKSGIKVGFAAMILSGLIISYTMALNAAVLGPDLLSRSTFPLFAVTSMINIGDFIQKMDGISVSSLMISYFFKATIYFYAAVLAVTDLFKLKSIKSFAIPLGGIVMFSSIMIAENSVENYIEGYIINPYVAFGFQSAFPIVLLAVGWMRRQRRTAS